MPPESECYAGIWPYVQNSPTSGEAVRGSWRCDLLRTGSHGLTIVRAAMIHDFRNYGDGARIDADVCIIGSGPAGLALAHEFLGSATRVVLLESGGLRCEPATEALNEAENVGLAHRGSVEGRARLF